MGVLHGDTGLWSADDLMIQQNECTMVELYPVNAAIPASDWHQVRVNGKPAFVHAVTINPTPEYQDIPAPAGMLCFDVQGSVAVEVTLAQAPDFVVIRPVSKGIEPVVEGKTVRFTLPGPGHYVLEGADRQAQPLFIFANPIRRDQPDAADPKVKYFGPGVHEAGLIRLHNDETLYLAGGALVKGIVRSDDAQNVRIMGPGILYAGHYTKQSIGQRLVVLKNCDNVLIRDIVCLDSPVWNINPVMSRRVIIDNIKVIGWRRNSDAIDPVNSDGLIIRNSFLKGQDDGVTLKGWESDQQPVVRDVLVEDCILWQNWMRGFVVGGEMRHIRETNNIVFRNSEILYSGVNPKSWANRDAALSVWNVDNAIIENVLFENIVVEYAHRLVRIAIVKNKHSATKDYGRVRNITFRNITVLDGPAFIEITGHDADHLSENITFENLRIRGQLIRSAQECHYLENEFVRNVRFVVTEP